MLTIAEEMDGGIVVLALAGRLDATTVDLLAGRIERQVAEGCARVLLDCAGLTYVSSAGLRVLIGGAKRTKAAGGALACCALQPSVQGVFDLSGFAVVLAVHLDRAAALKGF